MTGKLALNKGMIYGNMIAQMISVKGKKLFFYSRYNMDKHRNDIEIDFMLSNESITSMKIYPVEVKSSKNYTTSSLNEFKKIYSKRIGQSYIVHPKNYSIDDDLIKIPPYMLPLIFESKNILA